MSWHSSDSRYPGGLQLCPGQVRRTKISRLEETCRTTSHCHGLLKNWRETAYAGDENFIFASARLKGKAPRVPNMLVEDHLRPAAKQVIEIPDGHRFGFHNLRHALTSFLVEIGTDSKTIGHAALGRPFNPAQSLRALALGQAHGGPSKDDRSHGS